MGCLTKEKQQLIHSQVEEQREAVQSAQWKFFVTALRQDQLSLGKVKQVPVQVKARLHAKTVALRKEQADAGERATSGYQDPWRNFSEDNVELISDDLDSALICSLCDD